MLERVVRGKKGGIIYREALKRGKMMGRRGRDEEIKGCWRDATKTDGILRGGRS